MSDLYHNVKLARLHEAIEKRAQGFWRSFTSALTGTNIGKQVGEGLLASGTAAAVTGLGVAAEKGIGFLREKIEKPRAFKSMMETTPGLAKQDPKAVQMTFNTLYSLNKDMARDPLVAGSFVGRNVGRAEMTEGAGAYVDPQTVKMIMETGGRKGSPIMEAWQEGAGRTQLYKSMPGGDDGHSAPKLMRFRRQLGRK